jgi:hypothetical protein
MDLAWIFHKFQASPGKTFMGEAVFLIPRTHDNAARRCLVLARRVKKSSFFLRMVNANRNLDNSRQKPILMMVVSQHEIARFFHEISRLAGQEPRRQPVIFGFKDVRLQWEEGKGYKHPQTGQWVPEPRDCLRGWLEPDPEKRRQWVGLLAHIQEFWPRQEKLKTPLGEEVLFE